MTVNRTTLLDLPLPVTGTEDGTWGDVTNNALTQYLDIAVAGALEVTSSVTLATTEGDSSATNIGSTTAQHRTLLVPASGPSGNIVITAPASNRTYHVINLNATHTVQVRAGAGTGVTIGVNQSATVAYNGTDYALVGPIGPVVPVANGGTGITSFGTGVATFLGTPSSANLAAAVTDETGSGSLVFATSPTLVTPALGTPASGTLTNATGLPLTTGVTGTLAFGNGGTGQTSYTDGQLLIGNTATGGLSKATLTAGSNVTITNGNGTIEIASTGGGGGGGGTSVTVTQITATASQTTFNVTYTVGQLSVYLNGALLASADFTATNGTTVVLAAGAAVNDIFTAVAYSTVAGLDIESASPFMTAVGSGAGAVNTGINNVFVGFEAGNDNTTGAYNTAVGYQALDANTTGNQNDAFGFNALGANTTGNFNSALGSEALQANTTGTQNNAFGTGALKTNTTGSFNSAFGVNTLRDNTTGANNTAVGWNALLVNTTGADNTAVGYAALDANTTGANNVAVGVNALGANTTGADNTSVGYFSLDACTTGTFNTVLGRGSAGTLTTGSRNICIGRVVGEGSVDLTTGSSNILIGDRASTSTAGGTHQIVIGTAEFDLGKGNDTGYINPNGGNVFQGNNNSAWATTSDQRLKKNIVDNTEGLEKIANIRVRNFEYRLPEEVDPELKPSYAINKKGVQLGVIAQELQQVCPDCVTEQSTGILSVDTDEIFWHMVNAIKELSAKVEALEAQLKGN